MKLDKKETAKGNRDTHVPSNSHRSLRTSLLGDYLSKIADRNIMQVSTDRHGGRFDKDWLAKQLDPRHWQ